MYPLMIKRAVRSATNQNSDAQQAIMIIVVAAVMADGDIADEEVIRIRSMCSLSPIFASNSGDQDTKVILFAHNVNKQLGDQALVKAAEALTPELCETAFAFACDMVLADGLVGQSEEAFLNSLLCHLNVSESTARTIIDVSLIRNRNK